MPNPSIVPANGGTAVLTAHPFNDPDGFVGNVYSWVATPNAGYSFARVEWVQKWRYVGGVWDGQEHSMTCSSSLAQSPIPTYLSSEFPQEGIQYGYDPYYCDYAEYSVTSITFTFVIGGSRLILREDTVAGLILRDSNNVILRYS